MEKVKTEMAVSGLRDEFGQRYRVDLTLEWQESLPDDADLPLDPE